MHIAMLHGIQAAIFSQTQPLMYEVLTRCLVHEYYTMNTIDKGLLMWRVHAIHKATACGVQTAISRQRKYL